MVDNTRRKPAPAPDIDTDDLTIPRNADAEKAVVGAVLLDNKLYDEVADLIGPQHFFEEILAKIFELAGELISSNKEAKPITLMPFLHGVALPKGGQTLR